MKKRVFVGIFLAIFLTSLVSAMSINVNSPKEGWFYNTSSVPISVSSDEAVNWKAYLNGEYYDQHNNDNEWIEIFYLSDKFYTLRILASNISNSSISVENITSFYVDTIAPIILSQTPANGENVSRGSVSFSVGYTEANLNYTKIYYNSSSDPVLKEEIVTGCPSGTSVSCSWNINFSSFSYGTNISYFFSITDKVSRNANYSSVYTFKLICTPNWGNCTNWSSCSGGSQTRTCIDLNCGTGNRTESQSCSSCTPSCSGKSCGNDGCGGSCGSCGTGYSCVDGSCISDSTTTTTTQDTENVQNVNYFLSSSQFGNGSLRTLKLAGDKISFKIKNESHVLELRKIFSDKVSIKVSSIEQYANLSLNEVKKFDLTGDRYYDVLVTLKRLVSSEADILINATNEKVPETVATPVSTNIGNTTTTAETSNATGEVTNETETTSFGSRITGGFLGAFENMKETYVYLPIVFIAVIVGLLGISIFMVAKKKKRRKKGYYK